VLSRFFVAGLLPLPYPIQWHEQVCLLGRQSMGDHGCIPRHHQHLTESEAPRADVHGSVRKRLVAATGGSDWEQWLWQRLEMAGEAAGN
jgi:hypothetical protein